MGSPKINARRPFHSKNPYKSFATVQAAIDDLNGNGIIFIPAGTFNENLVIDENNVILQGSGWATIINGGITGHAIYVSGSNIVIRDLQTKTTAGSGNSYDGINITGDYTRIQNVYVSQSDRYGIGIGSAGLQCILENCFINNIDNSGIILYGANHTIVSCQITNAGFAGIACYCLNTIISNCFIDTTETDGIYLHSGAENCVVVGNRITNCLGEGINDDSGTSTVGNNDTT